MWFFKTRLPFISAECDEGKPSPELVRRYLIEWLTSIDLFDDIDQDKTLFELAEIVHQRP
ncbi:hypothetical protein [Kordiimonas sp. SCSIO 12610]|uniref:hypothetical protein n=1 Tax=Kordiimonas sp. SCSIO 12610 TaxID=2829597 RepID=UPI00210A0D46|nr:hypothetical protein [Kordiimonas sp. SCSIO 12610]UTW56117.1 hypothetical protein KFF44_04270 [Kordiimonas sp. SCSIO 12610]